MKSKSVYIFDGTPSVVKLRKKYYDFIIDLYGNLQLQHLPIFPKHCDNVWG